MTIQAILFDMDGVLIDARDWHYEALNRALELFGLAIDRDAHLATYDGLPTRKKLELLSKAKGLPIGLHAFVNELKQKHTLEIAYSRCKPTFVHQRAMAKLKERGMRTAVCSNSVRNSIELMMRLSQLDRYLDLVVSNEDVENPKPAPEIYLKAMNAFGLHPHECLILEDNEHGIAAATASGAHVMVIRNPSDVVYEVLEKRISYINAMQ